MELLKIINHYRRKKQIKKLAEEQFELIEALIEKDKEPIKENIEKIEKLLESSKQEKSLSSYYRNVKFIKAEVIMQES